MQPKLLLADNFFLAANPPRKGGYTMATTDKKCPPGMTYIPSQGTCIMMNDGNYMPVNELYIAVPQPDGSMVAVLESEFDDLDPVTWNEVMDILEPYNNPGMNGLFSKWRENRAERKEARQARRLERIEARGAARAGVAAAGGGFGSRLLEGVTSIFGGKNAGNFQGSYDTNSGLNLSYSNQPWYTRKETLIAGAAVAGLLLWQMNKSKA